MLHTFFMFNVQSQNPVGAISGVIDVSPMGAATYTIPIEVVPGTQGVQPNLSIVYNSYGDMGLLGMKWNLSGLSAITRCSPSKYYNDPIDAVPISFAVNRFALDGERLINIGSSGAIVYSTEEERFTRIHPVSNHTSFIAYTDDGSIMKYGSTVNSRQIMKENTSNTLTWLIDTITDFNGNYMSFKYMKSNNDEEVLIEKINYTSNRKSGMQTFLV